MAKRKITRAKVVSNRRIAEDHYLMEVEAAFLARNSFPGQFVSVKVGDGTTGPLLRVPLGVHAIRKSGIKLLYKTVGAKTGLLRKKDKGDILDILGPLGNGFDLAPAFSKGTTGVIIVAGGHGIAPLYALAEAIRKKGKKADLFMGVCDKKHIVCAGDMKKLGVKVHIATECGRRGYKGYVTDLLKKHLGKKGKKTEGKVIYACGPRPMLAALGRETAKYGIPAQVSLDAYMACGIGACLGCAVKTTSGYKMVCKDGPVFDIKEIEWEDEPGY